jgi:hypothetical protein
VKLGYVVIALLVSLPLAAQEERKKPAAKKPVARQQTAHSKATPEQVRKFNQLQKKQQQDSQR